MGGGLCLFEGVGKCESSNVEHKEYRLKDQNDVIWGNCFSLQSLQHKCLKKRTD